jgi:hypothetical protein
MHYMNGRPANNGDSIVLIPPYTKKPVAGVLYNATVGNNTCNGMLAPFTGGAHLCPNLAECIHLDDFAAGIPAEWPDTSTKTDTP